MGDWFQSPLPAPEILISVDAHVLLWFTPQRLWVESLVPSVVVLR
jgi:hypothetical protein